MAAAGPAPSPAPPSLAGRPAAATAAAAACGLALTECVNLAILSAPFTSSTSSLLSSSYRSKKAPPFPPCNAAAAGGSWCRRPAAAVEPKPRTSGWLVRAKRTFRAATACRAAAAAVAVVDSRPKISPLRTDGGVSSSAPKAVMLVVVVVVVPHLFRTPVHLPPFQYHHMMSAYISHNNISTHQPGMVGHTGRRINTTTF